MATREAFNMSHSYMDTICMCQTHDIIIQQVGSGAVGVARSAHTRCITDGRHALTPGHKCRVHGDKRGFEYVQLIHEYQMYVSNT